MKKRFIIVFIALLFIPFSLKFKSVRAEMPFYSLNPSDLVLRAEFSTDYSFSNKERKNNIELALKSLNGTFIEPNSEFSFNRTVGERSEKRGYKNAKIIVNGRFVEGLGGGVCQVSTTLYNAFLLADLPVLEWHAHSLPVSYIEPSFDAMVSYGYADLVAVNNTFNPVFIKTSFNGEKMTVKIYGEKMIYKIIRKSEIKEEIKAEIINLKDELGEYNLKTGQKKMVVFPKNGYKSQGEIIKVKNGKEFESKVFRSDKYSKTDGIIVIG